MSIDELGTALENATLNSKRLDAFPSDLQPYALRLYQLLTENSPFFVACSTNDIQQVQKECVHLTADELRQGAALAAVYNKAGVAKALASQVFGGDLEPHRLAVEYDSDAFLDTWWTPDKQCDLLKGCASRGFVDLVGYALFRYTHISFESKHEALMIAVRNGNCEVVSCFGVDVLFYNHNAALQCASARGNTSIVEHLLKKGARAQDALQEAAKNGHGTILLKLIKAGADCKSIELFQCAHKDVVQTIFSSEEQWFVSTWAKQKDIHNLIRLIRGELETSFTVTYIYKKNPELQSALLTIEPDLILEDLKRHAGLDDQKLATQLLSTSNIERKVKERIELGDVETLISLWEKVDDKKAVVQMALDAKRANVLLWLQSKGILHEVDYDAIVRMENPQLLPLIEEIDIARYPDVAPWLVSLDEVSFEAKVTALKKLQSVQIASAMPDKVRVKALVAAARDGVVVCHEDLGKALIEAAETGDEAAVKSLLKHNTPDKRTDAYIAAAKADKTNVLQFFRGYWERWDKDDTQALITAAAQGHIKTVQYLIGVGAILPGITDYPNALRKALEQAIAKTHPAIISLLRRQKYSLVTEREGKLIREAVATKEKHVVAAVIEGHEKEICKWALYNKHREVLTYLFDNFDEPIFVLEEALPDNEEYVELFVKGREGGVFIFAADKGREKLVTFLKGRVSQEMIEVAKDTASKRGHHKLVKKTLNNSGVEDRLPNSK